MKKAISALIIVLFLASFVGLFVLPISYTSPLLVSMCVFTMIGLILKD